MRTGLITLGATLALVVAGLASINAQAPAQPPQGGTAAPAPAASIVVENPNYVSLHLEVDVNRSAADVWKRIGKYCDIGEWFQIAAGCKILSGTEGEVGAVRSVANEVLVAKTELSYTYTQPVRAGRPVQPVPRYAGSAAGHGDDLEAALHADVGQLDAGR